MGIITAIISGALMSLQGVFNEGVTKQTSIWVSASFVQLTAFIVCILAWLFTGRDGNFSSLFSIQNKYMLLGVSFDWDERKGLNDFVQLSKELDEEYKIVLVGVNDMIKSQLPESIIAIGRTKTQKELADIINCTDKAVSRWETGRGIPEVSLLLPPPGHPPPPSPPPEPAQNSGSEGSSD